MRKWKILEMAYSEQLEKTIPTKVTDDYGRAWVWLERDLLYYCTKSRVYGEYVTFGHMIQRLDEAGLIVREALHEFA